MLTKIYPVFHREYPNVAITSLELSVKVQQELISRGDLDIGILTLRNNTIELIADYWTAELGTKELR